MLPTSTRTSLPAEPTVTFGPGTLTVRSTGCSVSTPGSGSGGSTVYVGAGSGLDGAGLSGVALGLASGPGADGLSEGTGSSAYDGSVVIVNAARNPAAATVILTTKVYLPPFHHNAPVRIAGQAGCLASYRYHTPIRTSVAVDARWLG